jgi:hypothetical protein
VGDRVGSREESRGVHRILHHPGWNRGLGSGAGSAEVDIRSLTIAEIEQLVARLQTEVRERDMEIAVLKRREEAVDSGRAEAFREGREVGRLEGEGRCLDRVSMQLAKRRVANRRETARAVQAVEGKYGDRGASSSDGDAVDTPGGGQQQDEGASGEE